MKASEFDAETRRLMEQAQATGQAPDWAPALDEDDDLAKMLGVKSTPTTRVAAARVEQYHDRFVTEWDLPCDPSYMDDTIYVDHTANIYDCCAVTDTTDGTREEFHSCPKYAEVIEAERDSLHVTAARIESERDARAEAEVRYRGDVDPDGQRVDDWGFADCERDAFVAGAEWARKQITRDSAA